MTSLFLDRLRTAGLIATVAGAVGSLAFMLQAGRRTPRFLLVIFVFWVLSPFAVLVWAHAASARWSEATRAALSILMLVLAPASLAVYGTEVLRPATAPAAFLFVLVPPVSCLLIVIVVPMAAFISRTRR
jgi:hypothetical protein